MLKFTKFNTYADGSADILCQDENGTAHQLTLSRGDQAALLVDMLRGSVMSESNQPLLRAMFVDNDQGKVEIDPRMASTRADLA